MKPLIAGLVGILGAGLTMGAPPPNDMENYRMSDGTRCPMYGTARSAAGKDLDRLKNRYDSQGTNDVEPDVTLKAMLQPGQDESRFQPTFGAKIKGFVIDVKVGGNETCNCKETKPIDRDTHIEVALAPGAAETDRLIVEVTPRTRELARRRGLDWTTATLKQSIKGKWVEVTGWMLFDTMHLAEAENTNPGGAGNWRATCWEIHPVTNIRVLQGPAAALPASAGPEVHDARANFATGVAPEEKAKHKARAKHHRSRFHLKDLDEELPAKAGG